jgi:4-hydroxybenzoate polyprenyltransferase
MSLSQKLPAYLALIRFNRPIGTLLLLWPCLWALWLANEGAPSLKLLVIFVLGTFLMRSAGCIINDFADRNIDGHVKRTRERPLATGQLSSKEALAFFVLLLILAFGLVLLTNTLTIMLSFAALLLAASYPFMKRYTHLPQVVLGAAFAFSIPMAFAASSNELPRALWLIYIATVLWTIVYDTFYAMVDRDDDVKIGVKSTAILFGDDDKSITALLQGSTILVLVLMGAQFKLGYWFYLAVIVAGGLFIYQQRLIKGRNREACFHAFLHNNYVGMVIFSGIVLHYLFH